ncbi:hypothetical protein [Pseudonocardia sp. DLS-67]
MVARPLRHRHPRAHCVLEATRQHVPLPLGGGTPAVLRQWGPPVPRRVGTPLAAPRPHPRPRAMGKRGRSGPDHARQGLRGRGLPVSTAPIDTLSPIVELFDRSMTGFWATTYNIDLRLFSEYLLPRLGNPPVNITVLADQRRLAHGLGRLGADQLGGLATVNRRWLLRGVRPAGPAFHPKSYLSVAPGRVLLLVGSGNLSAGGLDDGRETFTAFRSGEPDGDRALAEWRGWMRRLVRAQSDPLLSERLVDLESRLPAAIGPDGPWQSMLLDNLDEPLDRQILTRLRADGVTVTDELLLAAPFYDADAAAVERLVVALDPPRIVVHVTSSTSVHGAALRRVSAGRELVVRAYEPDRFTHTKLIGAVSGERGWLVSGSANLSRAALLNPARAGGNVELGVLTRLPAADVRGRFVPPGTTAMDRPVEILDSLVLAPDEDMPAHPVLLRRAEAGDDGSVLVTTEPHADDTWLLADGEQTLPLVVNADGSGRTRGAVDGRLVHLVDPAGTRLSNPVVVDDVAGLAAALGDAGAETDRDLPPELAGVDARGPLVDALALLHRELVMDVSERADAVVRGTGGGAAGSEGEDDDFWSRLEREQLASDARAGRYRQPVGGPRDVLLQVVEMLGAAVPAASDRSSIAGGDTDDPRADDRPAGSRRWGATTRLRVRVRNLLRRWAAAQTDPRLRWIDRFAPVANFAVMAGVLAQLRVAAAQDWPGTVLREDDVDEIWWLWLRALVGTGRRDGLLDGSDEVETNEVLGSLALDVRESAAFLCWVMIRRGADQRERIVAVQDVLVPALEHGLLEPTQHAASQAVSCGEERATPASMTEDLLSAATFVDDELWCAKSAEELGLDGIWLEERRGHPVPLAVHVAGISAPLADPRLPRLVASAVRYRRVSAATVLAAGLGVGRRDDVDGWRLVWSATLKMYFMRNRADAGLDSSSIIDSTTLQDLVASGRSLEAVFPTSVIDGAIG